jgi:hypothetical protein
MASTTADTVLASHAVTAWRLLVPKRNSLHQAQRCSMAGEAGVGLKKGGMLRWPGFERLNLVSESCDPWAWLLGKAFSGEEKVASGSGTEVVKRQSQHPKIAALLSSKMSTHAQV